MMVLAAPAAAAPRRLAGEDILMRAGIVALAALLLLFIALPLATLLLKSFQDSAGHFVGLSNYGRYFATPTLVASVWNSLGVAVLTTAIVVLLSLEIGATALLVGAQVISEYEQVGRGRGPRPTKRLRTA